MTRAWQGYTCPKCNGSMRTTGTGRANDGRYVVRSKRCDDCDYKCITAETFLQESEGMTSVETFDPEQRFAKRERRRKKYGYHGIGCGHEKTVRRITASATMHGRGGGKVICGHKV